MYFRKHLYVKGTDSENWKTGKLQRAENFSSVFHVFTLQGRKNTVILQQKVGHLKFVFGTQIV